VRRERELLLRFLGGRGCERQKRARPTSRWTTAIGRRTWPLVTLVEEWRSAVRVPEAVLELGERRMILRTEA
jgi:hypothetical protein